MIKKKQCFNLKQQRKDFNMQRYFQFIALIVPNFAGNNIEFKYIVSFNLNKTNTEEQNQEIIKNQCITFWKNKISDEYFTDSYFVRFYISEVELVSLEGTELEFFKPTEDYSYLYDRKELLQKIISSIED